MAAINGSHRRQRNGWEQARWQTWCILSALGAKMQSPRDLVKFQWEEEKHEPTETISDEEIQRLQELIRNENNLVFS